MIDEPNKQPTEPMQAPAGIWEHWCEHPGCDKWGCFGERDGKETHWHCGQHAEGWRSQ